ncbi:MAG: hypothetical protein V1672_02850 [Candidatus Diapherotrites archaeon]
MKVKDLKARAEVDEITLEIVSKAEPREFTNDRGSGRVCSAAGKDSTGEVSITLWNEQIDQVEEGNKIKIEGGWCSDYQGNLQVSTGRKGNLTVL